jgi:hypothetical protein
MGQIRYVQRLLDWTEVNFYPRRRSGAQWDPATVFPNRAEFDLARLRMIVAGRTHEARVIAVSGHLFSLVVRPSPKRHPWGPVELSTVQVMTDPLRSDFNPPKQLPPSYTRFIDLRGPGACSGWEVLAPDEVYAVSLSEGDYLVLASREGTEFLVTETSSPSPTLYRVGLGGGPVPTDRSFEEALRSVRPDDRGPGEAS